MTVQVRMARAVPVYMFVLVEDDLESASERVSDLAQSREARKMVAALKPRDHRFGHAQSLGETHAARADDGRSARPAWCCCSTRPAAVIFGPLTSSRHDSVHAHLSP